MFVYDIVYKIIHFIFSFNEKGNDVFTDIKLKFKKGEAIGLIGSSGAGKTTLINIILGLITLEQGTIKINNINLCKVTEQWQNRIAYLSQDGFIIDDTLEQNIALGVKEEDIDKNFLKYSIEKSNLSDFVKSLPNGYKTIVGEHGSKISGGQRQRICIARALYFKKDIFVLDESTSALDQTTENKIIEELQRLKGDKTFIIISHRLNVLSFCDRIYKLNNGIINNLGSYEDFKN